MSTKSNDDLKREIKELRASLEALEDLMFAPKEYRDAFKANAEGSEEGEIFEVLFTDIVDYAKKSSSFKSRIMLELELHEESPATKTSRSGPRHSFSPRIRSSVMYAPRSSRPLVD